MCWHFLYDYAFLWYKFCYEKLRPKIVLGWKNVVVTKIEVMETSDMENVNFLYKLNIQSKVLSEIA